MAFQLLCGCTVFGKRGEAQAGGAFKGVTFDGKWLSKAVQQSFLKTQEVRIRFLMRSNDEEFIPPMRASVSIERIADRNRPLISSR